MALPRLLQERNANGATQQEGENTIMKEIEIRKNALLELTKPELIHIKAALVDYHDKLYNTQKLGPHRVNTEEVGELLDAISGVLGDVSKS
jgi:hypothetical protein